MLICPEGAYDPNNVGILKTTKKLSCAILDFGDTVKFLMKQFLWQTNQYILFQSFSLSLLSVLVLFVFSFLLVCLFGWFWVFNYYFSFLGFFNSRFVIGLYSLQIFYIVPTELLKIKFKEKVDSKVIYSHSTMKT